MFKLHIYNIKFVFLFRPYHQRSCPSLFAHPISQPMTLDTKMRRFDRKLCMEQSLHPWHSHICGNQYSFGSNAWFDFDLGI